MYLSFTYSIIRSQHTYISSECKRKNIKVTIKAYMTYYYSDKVEIVCMHALLTKFEFSMAPVMDMESRFIMVFLWKGPF